MVVYFDKNNCLNYLKTFDDSESGRDTLRMLKKQLNVHLNFPISELDEYEFTLLEEFQSGVSEEFRLTYGDEKISRPLKRSSFPSQSGIYLLEDSNIQTIIEQHFVIIADLGKEVDTLQKLIINHDYSFHKEKLIGTDITPTTHLDILDLPFSTLLIVDRYMFKGPETGGNIGLYDFNLDKVLRKIYGSKKSPSRIIFVYQINVKVAKSNNNYDEGPNLSKLSDKIKNITIKHCPAPDIYFIGVPSGYIDDEHDRYIISNYLRIKSGDCLIYFDSSGNVTTKSKTVDLYSLGKREYRDVNAILLKKVSEIIKETLDKYPTYSKVPSGTVSSQVIDFR